jgi:hypothetical protein
MADRQPRTPPRNPRLTSIGRLERDQRLAAPTRFCSPEIEPALGGTLIGLAPAARERLSRFTLALQAAGFLVVAACKRGELLRDLQRHGSLREASAKRCPALKLSHA